MPSYRNDAVVSVSNSTNKPAVQGEGTGNEGVRGVSHGEHGAVVGINDFSPSAPPGAGGNGGWFESTQGEGVRGWAKSRHHGGVVGVNSDGGCGVYGQSDDGAGIVGESKNNEGVRGVSHSSHGGVVGVNDWSPSGPPGAGGNGGWFESTQGEGVRGTAKNPDHGGVVGINTANGIAIFGQSGGIAGRFEGSVEVTGNSQMKNARFEGDVEVTGDIRLTNADCAEDFDIGTGVTVEPGTVMVLGENGCVVPSEQAYDKRVAGVVSGAGNYKPGILLDKQVSARVRQPIGLLGKLYCKVDAHYGAISIGDLLTTSSTQGHAMRADEPGKAFGAVIGKAMQSFSEGRGLILILISGQ
jgi:hypothetical protein